MKRIIRNLAVLLSVFLVSCSLLFRTCPAAPETSADSAAPSDEAEAARTESCELKIFDETDYSSAETVLANISPETDLKLTIYGDPDYYIPLLLKYPFRSLELEIREPDYHVGPASQITEWDGVTYHMSDVHGLISLTLTESSVLNFDRTDVYEELEHLTVRCEDSGSAILGFITDRQMPALRTLTIECENYSVLENIMDKQGMIFPEHLENIELFYFGQKAAADQINGAPFLAAVTYDCPDVRINGYTPQELLDRHEADFEKGELDDARAIVLFNHFYDTAYYGEGPSSYDTPPIYGKMLIYDSFHGYLSSRVIRRGKSKANVVNNYFFEIPEEQMAETPEEADLMIMLSRNTILAGYYAPGVEGYDIETSVLVTDMNTGVIYAPFTGAYDMTPEELGIQVYSDGTHQMINGYGEYLPKEAVQTILEAYGSAPEEESAEGEPAEGPAGTGQVEPEQAEDESAEPELIELPAALQNETYAATYAALQNGESVVYGAKSRTAGGVQQTLVDLGCSIAVDGSFGPASVAALQQLQSRAGLSVTDYVDADVYLELLSLVK